MRRRSLAPLFDVLCEGGPDEEPSPAAGILLPYMTDCSRSGNVCAYVYRALGRNMEAVRRLLDHPGFWHDFFVVFLEGEKRRVSNLYTSGALEGATFPLSFDVEIAEQAPRMVRRATNAFSALLPAQLARDFAVYCTFECLDRVRESYVLTMQSGGRLWFDYVHQSQERTVYAPICNQILYAVEVAGTTTAVTGPVMGFLKETCLYLPTARLAEGLEASLWSLRAVILQILRKGTPTKIPVGVWGIIFEHAASHPEAMQPRFALEQW